MLWTKGRVLTLSIKLTNADWTPESNLVVLAADFQAPRSSKIVVQIDCYDIEGHVFVKEVERSKNHSGKSSCWTVELCVVAVSAYPT